MSTATKATDVYASSVATTGRVSVNSSVASSIDHSGDTDWFGVTLAAGQSYTIDLQGSATGQGTLSDPYLRGIHNASGTLLSGTTDDDSGDGLDSRVSFSPATAGTYFISAGAYSSGTGSYRLYVTKAGSAADDYASSTSTTGTVSVGGSVTGTVNSSGDADWFAVTLTAGQSYTIDLQGADSSQGTLANPYLQGVYTASGTLLSGTSDHNSGTGVDSQVTFTAATSGTYYIAARGYGTGTGTYTLSVARTDDYANSASTTGTVSVGGSTTGTINYAGDTDWIAVTLTAGQTYTVDVQGADSSQGTLANPYLLGVHTSSGTLVSGTSDHNSGTGLDSRVTFTATATGTYYVAARGYGTGTGTYTVAVTQVDDYAASKSTTGTVSVGDSVAGVVNSPGDTDWFAVTLTAGQSYTIDLQGVDTGKGTLANPYLQGVYTASGTFLSGTSDHNSGTGLDSRVTFTATTTGTYYVAARGYGAGTGTYTLSVSKAGSVADDYASSTSTTGQVSVGGSVTGTIGTTTDADWFAVTLTAGTQYTIDLEGATVSAGTLADPLISGIFNSSGTLLSSTTDNDSGGDANSHLCFTPTTSGTYYIAADGNGTSTGTYTLSLEKSADDATWTIMTYLCADNNLEPDALTDVNEMESATITDTIVVTCQLDRSSSYSTADDNWTTTRRGVIEQDGTTSHISSLATSMTEQNMGAVSTLTSFINWSAAVSTEEYTALVLWNHGGGVDGCCWDDASGDANLSISEVATAIDNSTLGHVDLVAFDACLMAVLDQAYALVDYADIMVASEDVEPSTGYDYTSLLNAFSASATQTEEELAELIVQTYDADNTDSVTMSALDLSEIDDLTDAMQDFATVWSSSGLSASVLATAEDRTLEYYEHIDLVDFMENIQDLSSSTTVDTAAEAVISAVEDVVIASCGESAANGLTIYMPDSQDSSYLTGTGASLLAATGWTTIYNAVWSA
ncbi:clostripain-related cysteine peptidase [Desulfolutivibrio sulfoxidireducens]|uniref:clostripain-related cysteine peptidase n=1 Tax=Desulfolutivibrio sulfoxidireducens TaxID=2773299 RepID=UPI00159D5943|nr:clostripain-related cysteine peptidase [Desulfolutivibrio sulfoxidireducens]QLA14669.1 hypothetical protein GD605_00135 [Desulfolutivibrio sulfoxidireducens]